LPDVAISLPFCSFKGNAEVKEGRGLGRGPSQTTWLRFKEIDLNHKNENALSRADFQWRTPQPAKAGAAMSLARLWRDQGKWAQARDLLAPAYG
jgi:hypothetical protein